jgi:3-dehydroquinate dehydratase-2
MAKHLLLINGPNLNLLGTREPDKYGAETLPALVGRLDKRAHEAGARLETFQSNSEGAIVERIQSAATEGIEVILINPAAYTHTSVAIRDALAAVAIPFIEIHLTNIHAREAFRHRSFLSDLATAVVGGLGPQGYDAALAFALDYST